MKRTIALIAVGVALLGVLAATGCTRVPLSETIGGAPTPVTVDKPSFELEGAETFVGTIRMGVGELALSGSDAASDTVSGRLEYAPISWKPEVKFETDGTKAQLWVDQPESEPMQLGNDVRNAWKLVFPSGVPTELSLKLGVGESKIDLRKVDVRELEVLTGVGSATIDLSGDRQNDVIAEIECGVGETIIRVPKGMGVRITGAEDGVGDFEAPGFSKDDRDLVNNAYATTAPKLAIKLTRGVGDVRIEQVP
jgi:hypothetical protein